MINLFKAEFYKLYKGRAFWICCLVSCFMSIFVYGSLFLADSIQNEEMQNGTGGVYVSSDDNMQENSSSILGEITIPDMLQQMVFGSFGSIIIGIFACIFVFGEYGNGAVKNIVGKGYPRWKIFLTKYIAVMAAAVAQLVILTVFTSAAGVVIQCVAGVTQEWSAEFLKDLFCYLGLELLLGAALAGIITLFIEVCRNLAGGIAIGLLIITFSSVITSGLDLLICYFFPGTEFRVSDYGIMELIADCPLQQPDGSFVIHVVMVAAAWMIFAGGAGIMHFKKADIS